LVFVDGVFRDGFPVDKLVNKWLLFIWIFFNKNERNGNPMKIIFSYSFISVIKAIDKKTLLKKIFLLLIF
jgi:hypothetical protein